MRIAIVHTSSEFITLLNSIISTSGFELCWSCDTAKQCSINCADDLPDLLLVDLAIQDMRASELIKNIMTDTPTTVIAVTNATNRSPGRVFEAMSAGALDVISEPAADQPDSIQDLQHKIANINKLHHSLRTPGVLRKKTNQYKYPLVAIGSSTGGPAALLTILKQLPANPAAVFVIIQHMDSNFSQGMADWLNQQTSIQVEIARENHSPKIGHVYMAATNDHLILNHQGCFQYISEPEDYPYRPSVNVFFESALTHWPDKIIGVILTGMGRDGANGLLSLYNRGMLTIAQDKQSCAVYGMPRAACDLQAVTIELDIHQIADKILQNLNSLADDRQI